MKPCSAWCRPDEGVHVDVDYFRTEHSVLKPGEVTSMGDVDGDLTCVPPPGWVQILAVEHAPEAPPSSDPDGWPVARLMTVQVLP